ncbi:MAG: tagaturonate reductase, partial [Lachnospiraceae bacterium]|nr:tagaturonate reductase [Lachnospiraceae bacterium]
MNIINSAMFSKKERDIKVLQFGEGGFLRAFVDYMIDIMNEKGTFDGNIVLVKPIAFGSLDNFRKQDCNYTVLLRGLKDG